MKIRHRGMYIINRDGKTRFRIHVIPGDVIGAVWVSREIDDREAATLVKRHIYPEYAAERMKYLSGQGTLNLTVPSDMLVQ